MVTKSTQALQGFSYVPLSAIAVGDVIKPTGFSKPFTVSGIIPDTEENAIYFTNHNKKGERQKGWGFLFTDTLTADTVKVLRKD